MFTPFCLGSGYKYWRVRFLVAPPDQEYVYELEMRGSVGGPDLCVGGTASASTTQGGYPASQAFDNDPALFWLAGVFGGLDGWLQYTFLDGVDIKQLAFTSPTSATSIGLEYSVTGSAPWVSVKTGLIDGSGLFNV